MPRSRTVAALSANRASSSARRPNSLSSIAPPTLNRSVITLPMSALPSICSRVSPASLPLTRREVTNSSGKSSRHSRVTCQLSAIIATPTTTTEMALETVLGQGGGERPLGADHVVVEPRDERAGLGAGEERQRLPLHVGEHLGAQVVDQALTDAGGEPAGDHGEHRAEDRGAAISQRHLDDHRGVLGEDAVVDDPLDEQRGDDHQAGVDHREHEEDGDQAAVRPGERQHPPDRATVELAVDDAAVGAHVAPHLTHPAHA